MKIQKHSLIIFLLLCMALNMSCRKEVIEFEQAPPEDSLTANPIVANLIQRVAMNDGSKDNIVNNSNCFNFQMPFTVIANGLEVNVNSDADLNVIEDIFDEFDNDNDALAIIFPIVIILIDYTEVIINNDAELYNYSSNCNDENESDDDIECIDFQYPMSFSIFNTSNELLETITINNDKALYLFIDEIDENDLITVLFPLNILLSDETVLVVNNLNELENAIEDYDNTCDEDDDYDYNDDDCDDCTPLLLTTLLTNCSDWTVDKLKRNENNYDTVYDGYTFNFFNNGTVSVYWDNITVYGSWSISGGTGNNIMIVIDIPDLSYCNLNWRLHEIKQNIDGTKIDLRDGDDDRLRYINNCN